MEKSLLYLVEEELLNEAKRVVPIVYDEKELLSCKSGEVIRKNINPLYEEFYTELELRTIPLCCMKKEGKDYLQEKVDLKPTIEHFKKYKSYKEEMNNINIDFIVDSIALDLINNKYDDSIFIIMPKLLDNYMKCHHDSVDCRAIIWLLDDSLKKHNYKLTSTNLSDLQEIKE